MSNAAAPGWYHAEGDPPNTERYWDGFAWTEGPRPVAAATDAPTDVSAADIPSTGAPATGMPVMGEPSDAVPPSSDLPSIDSPAASAGPSNMPVMGSTTGGLDSGFPSLDDPPLSEPAVGGASSLPGDVPGGLGAPPVTGTPGLPPADFGSSPTPGGFPSAPPPAFGAAYAEKSQATSALVASVVGLLCCGPAAVGGAYLGYKEKVGIDEGRRDPSSRGVAIAALVIGAVGAGLWLLGLLFFFGGLALL